MQTFGGLLIIASLLTLACNGSSAHAKDSPLPKPGESYTVARQQLLGAGWRPVVFTACSPRNICFEAWPEMATQMPIAITCGTLVWNERIVTICLEPIADDALVKSIVVH